MAEETTTPETAEATEDPTITVEEPDTTAEAEAQAPEQPEGEPESGGAGSKEAVLADLAKERDRRQEEQAARARDAEAFEEERKTWQEERTQLTRELALYRNGAGANIPALLDSKSFTEKLASLEDPTDEAVTALIKETVDANPVFASTPVKPAALRDAGAGADPEPAQATDWLRAAIQKL